MSSSGNAVTTAATPSCSWSTADAMPMGGRRLLTSQRAVRSAMVRASSRMRVCTFASTTVSKASMDFHKSSRS